ncbi:MAG: hypothetical protein ACRDAM_07330, partial [Casimicrobium sp.]
MKNRTRSPLYAPKKAVMSMMAAIAGAALSLPVSAQNQPGALDTTFNSTGIVTSTVAGNGADRGRAMLIDGYYRFQGIVIGGSCKVDTQDQFCMLRYDNSGALSNSATPTTIGGFGINGRVVTQVGAVSSNAEAIAYVRVNTVGLTVDQIVLGGSCFDGTRRDFCLASYNRDGSLNTTFGNAGKVILSASDGENRINAITSDTNGNIYAVGSCRETSGGEARQCAAKFDIYGQLDTSFGTGGVAHYSPATFQGTIWSLPSGNDFALGAITDLGKLVIAGNCSDGQRQVYCLTALDGATGRPMDPFGHVVPTRAPGRAMTPLGDTDRSAYALDISPFTAQNGRYLVTGSCVVNGQTRFCTARYNINGFLDTSFGEGAGYVTTAITNGDNV